MCWTGVQHKMHTPSEYCMKEVRERQVIVKVHSLSCFRAMINIGMLHKWLEYVYEYLCVFVRARTSSEHHGFPSFRFTKSHVAPVLSSEFPFLYQKTFYSRFFFVNFRFLNAYDDCHSHSSLKEKHAHK